MGLSILPAIVVGCSYNSFQTFGSITYHISHYFVSRILLLSLVGSSSGTSFLGGPASFWYCSGWILDGFPVFVEKISFTWMKRTKDKSLQRVFERPKKHVVSKNWGFDLYKYTIGIQTTNPRHQANQALDTPTIKPLDFWNWIRDDGLGIGFQYGYVAFFIYKETRIGNRPEHVSVEKA